MVLWKFVTNAKESIRREKELKKCVGYVENRSDINPIISVILNVNRLSNLIKLQRLSY